MSEVILAGNRSFEPGRSENPVICRTIAAIQGAVRDHKLHGARVGLVPTMGALHEGHAELIRACRRDVDVAVVSLFVNPTQFGPHEDFDRYPRSFDADVALCQRAGAAVIFAPGVAEMYPSGGLSSFVEVPDLSAILEGASRPGHFRGVATVVLKLLNAVGPDQAHFGCKDYQQLQVIRRMVRDLDVPTEIVAVPTVREPDGLAMSSRNRYLDPAQRQAATVLSAALQEAQVAVRGGEQRADSVRQILRTRIESEPLATLDYAEVVDPESLRAVDTIDDDHPAVALLAARVGPARLIDNAPLPG